MRTTTFKCDRCGTEFVDGKDADGKPVQTWTLQLIYKCGEVAPYSLNKATGVLQRADKKLTAEWCRKCMDEKGITPPPHGTPEEEKPPPPTIEDMIREICQEEMDGRRGS